jgi:hypothetical protein
VVHIGQITTHMFSPVVQVAVLVVGCLAVYVAFKIGIAILKIVLGLVGIMLLVGAIWWFISGFNH